MILNYRFANEETDALGNVRVYFVTPNGDHKYRIDEAPLTHAFHERYCELAEAHGVPRDKAWELQVCKKGDRSIASAQEPRERRNVLPPGMTPRGLSSEQAAAYFGIGTSTFITMVHSGRAPRPIVIGKRHVWDVKDLDRALDALSPNQQPSMKVEFVL